MFAYPHFDLPYLVVTTNEHVVVKLKRSRYYKKI